MKKYGPESLEKFLKAIDNNLTKPVELVIIGGAAASLAYKVKMVTQDIDAISNIKALMKAYEKAKAETGFHIPLEQTGTFDGPHSFEDRLQTVDGNYKFLTIKVPEIHDLILMKVVRGFEHDLEGIEEMVKRNDVSQDILIERFTGEMGAVIGDPRTLKSKFLGMIDRVFGEEAALSLEKKI